MRYCEFTIILKKKNPNGTISIQKHRCGSGLGLREVEFKHPDYRDQMRSAVLCTSHYLECFGEWEKIKDVLWRKWKNTKWRYYKDFKKAKKYAEYFNEFDFRKMNYRKVDLAYNLWNDHTRKVCCFELCDVRLDSVTKVYPILVYKPTGRMSYKLECCSIQHWEKFKYRIGMLAPPDPNKPKPISLDTFTEVIK